MFKKVFNLFGKDEPPPPEVRRIPSFAKDLKEGDWLTTQVFIDNNDKNARVYYAAYLSKIGPNDIQMPEHVHLYKQGETTWRLVEYKWNTKDKAVVDAVTGVSTAVTEKYLPRVRNAEDALKHLATYEKNGIAPESGYTAVPELKGNYRQLACLHGLHFDDKNEYIRVAKDKPVTVSAVFNKSQIDTLFSPGDKQIRTWGDLHSLIVNKYPAPSAELHDEWKDKVLPSWLGYCKYLVDETKPLFSKKIKYGSLKEQKTLLDRMTHPAGYDYPVYGEVNNGDVKGEVPIAYHVDVFCLVTMLREAGEAYKLFAFAPIDAMQDCAFTIHMLANHIQSVCEKRLSLTAEQTRQIVNLIMQGPDPFADQPLPLEKWLADMDRQPQAKPQTPKL